MEREEEGENGERNEEWKTRKEEGIRGWKGGSKIEMKGDREKWTE